MKTHLRLLFFIFILAVTFVRFGPGHAQPARRAPCRPVGLRSNAVFIENQGQWENDALRYKLNHPTVHVELGRHVTDFRLPACSAGGEVAFSVRFPGSRVTEPVGSLRAGEVFHYHPGNGRPRRENVPAWREVLYPNLYCGIDLQVTAQAAGLKFEFLLAPGADWREVQVRYNGIERLELREDGSLAIHLRNGVPPLVDHAPVIYQERNGQRVYLPGRFRLVDAATCGFEIDGQPDRTLPLVIDPLIEWGSYVHELGAVGDGAAFGVATDSAGNVVLTGESPCFVTKISPPGAHLWTAYFPSNYTGRNIKVDNLDNIIVGGMSVPGSDVSGFVSKLNSSGMHQWTRTPRGGVIGLDVDGLGRIVVAGRAGNVFVTGNTASGGWTVGGPDLTHNGDTDAFVAKLTLAGALVWSSYLGGTNTDEGRAIAHDGGSRIFVAGSTKPGVWEYDVWATNYHRGTWDAFVATFTDVPLPLIRIQRIEPLGTGSFRLVFSITADPPPGLQVQRAIALATPISWVTESGTVITPMAPGLLQADVARQAGQCFYRLHKP